MLEVDCVLDPGVRAASSEIVDAYEPSVTFAQISMNDRGGGVLSAQGGAGLSQRLGRHIGTSA